MLISYVYELYCLYDKHFPIQSKSLHIIISISFILIFPPQCYCYILSVSSLILLWYAFYFVSFLLHSFYSLSCALISILCIILSVHYDDGLPAQHYNTVDLSWLFQDCFSPYWSLVWTLIWVNIKWTDITWVDDGRNYRR